MKEIKPEEIKKYEEGRQMFKRLPFYDIEDKEKYEVCLGDGIKAETDVANKTIVLINKNKEKFELNTLLPAGYEFEFLKHSWTVDVKDKKVITPIILDEMYLIICLHEMGHVADYDINKVVSMNYSGWDKNKKEEFLKKNNAHANRERRAWAWSLKKFLQLQKQGFISGKITKQRLMEIAKAALYTYAKDTAMHHDPGSGQYLNKEVTRDGEIITN